MKGFLSVIAFVALIAMLLGMNVGGAAQMAVTPKPSQEVVNKIAEQKAKDEADALKAWRETWNGLIRVFKYGLAGTFVVGFAIAGTVVVQRVIRRNDRPLDDNGHAPLVPAKADLAGLPPLFIQVGADEILLSDAIEFARRAALAGIDVRLHVWADMVHAWPLFHFALPVSGLAAIDEAIKCREEGTAKTILFNLTGTGYFDMQAYMDYEAGKMKDYVPTDADLEAGFATLPKIPGIQE